jgi:hypothetical protein
MPKAGGDLAHDASNSSQAAPATSQPDADRARELARLSALLARQRAGNRRWQLPLGGLALGSVLTAAGALLFLDSVMEGVASCDGEEDYDCDDDHDQPIYAGLTLMALGQTLLIISTPLLIIMGGRASRMKRTEAEIRRLGGQISLAPTIGPRGAAGLRVHARF